MNPHIQNHHGDTPSLWKVPVVIVFIQLCFFEYVLFLSASHDVRMLQKIFHLVVSWCCSLKLVESSVE